MADGPQGHREFGLGLVAAGLIGVGLGLGWAGFGVGLGLVLVGLGLVLGCG